MLRLFTIASRSPVSFPKPVGSVSVALWTGLVFAELSIGAKVSAGRRVTDAADGVCSGADEV